MQACFCITQKYVLCLLRISMDAQNFGCDTFVQHPCACTCCMHMWQLFSSLLHMYSNLMVYLYLHIWRCMHLHAICSCMIVCTSHSFYHARNLPCWFLHVHLFNVRLQYICIFIYVFCLRAYVLLQFLLDCTHTCSCLCYLFFFLHKPWYFCLAWLCMLVSLIVPTNTIT